MPRALFCWEIGEGSGHVRPYLGVLRALRERGWEVALALKNTSVIGDEMRRGEWTVFQAPVCLNEFTGIAPNPVNHTEIYLGFGFAHADTLMGLVCGWRSLFSLHQPDLLICNNAPAALLAAHIDARAAIRVGMGFDCPPAGERAPLIVPWRPDLDARLERAEDLALKTVNDVLRDSSRPLVPSLGPILSPPALLATIPELDHFPNRGTHGTYLGPLAELRNVSRATPDGDVELFAYLRLQHQHTVAMVAAIAKSGRPTWLYLPDATEAQCVSLSSGALTVSRAPFDAQAAIARARVVVSYAGHAMTLSALLAGKPLLLLPDHGEQMANARRAAEIGAALVVDVRGRHPKLGNALKEICEQASFAQAAQAFAATHREWTPECALQRFTAACEEAVPPQSRLRIVGVNS